MAEGPQPVEVGAIFAASQADPAHSIYGLFRRTGFKGATSRSPVEFIRLRLEKPTNVDAIRLRCKGSFEPAVYLTLNDQNQGVLPCERVRELSVSLQSIDLYLVGSEEGRPYTLELEGLEFLTRMGPLWQPRPVYSPVPVSAEVRGEVVTLAAAVPARALLNLAPATIRLQLDDRTLDIPPGARLPYSGRIRTFRVSPVHLPDLVIIDEREVRVQAVPDTGARMVIMSLRRDCKELPESWLWNSKPKAAGWLIRPYASANQRIAWQDTISIYNKDETQDLAVNARPHCGLPVAIRTGTQTWSGSVIREVPDL